MPWFDLRPEEQREVMFGPAPRPLAALPLKSENGLLIVAGGFTGRSRQANELIRSASAGTVTAGSAVAMFDKLD